MKKALAVAVVALGLVGTQGTTEASTISGRRAAETNHVSASRGVDTAASGGHTLRTF